jgi:hypothetical protein
MVFCKTSVLRKTVVYGDGAADINSQQSLFQWSAPSQNTKYTRVGPKVSGLTHKSRAKWEIPQGIYSAIYGEVTVPVSVCVEIKGDYIEK